MNKGLFLSLQERGLVQDFVPGLDELLNRQKVSVYAGFDPTADSLHIGNLVPIMLLVHFQQAGHRPIALVGGATGRVGDPTGRSAERSVMPLEQIEHHIACQKAQLRQFLDFDSGRPSAALMVNNNDWFGSWGFLDFIADVGKHVPINYMLAKDSVKLRLENGMSFMEFCYQLVQGYDFVHLYKHHDCLVQVGGSDQWGNITTGTELIRRMTGGEAWALTAPLTKKADGSKFGKSEGGMSGWIRSKPALIIFTNFGSTSATKMPFVICPFIPSFPWRRLRQLPWNMRRPLISDWPSDDWPKM